MILNIQNNVGTEKKRANKMFGYNRSKVDYKFKVIILKCYNAFERYLEFYI